MSNLTVWGIPCPRSGDESDPSGLAYRAWFWLYANNQRVRHTLGLHQRPHTYSIAPRCDWCGHRSAAQSAIAERNRTHLTTTTHAEDTEATTKETDRG